MAQAGFGVSRPVGLWPRSELWDTGRGMAEKIGIAGRLHRRWVHARRVRVLSDHLSPLLRPRARVLDVGAGDGRLAARLAVMRSDLEIRCVDVSLRSTMAYPVECYDGKRLPFGRGTFDAVLLIDVLHHTSNPQALLAEAHRVGSVVVIKDHVLDGWLADATLRFMDWVGNARHGVPLPFRYWTRALWEDLFARMDLAIRSRRSELGIYPWPATLLFDRQLHFLVSLERNCLEAEIE